MLAETGLWQDLQELPESLAATVESRDGVGEAAALLDGARRVVASGNGAAYYAAMALWLASLESDAGPAVVAVPSGLLARGAFRWRPGDAFVAVSSSGELRDLVEAIAGSPRPYVSVTASPESTLATQAGARALSTVLGQRALAHTQAFCGAVAVVLAIWAELTSDAALRDSLRAAPSEVAASLADTQEWLDEVETPDPTAAVVLGSGPAWAGALEAALLLKELAGVPAEGLETREGATSAMTAVAPGHVVIGLSPPANALLDEAEEICRSRGATVLRPPARESADPRLAALVTHPAAALLSARIGHARGLDVDRPAWTEAYYRVARRSA